MTTHDPSLSASIPAMTSLLRTFAQERDWEKFHTPKNLIIALMGEVGELAELFQWLTVEEAGLLTADANHKEKVSDELADVAAYLFRLADVLGIDLAQAMHAKIAKNGEKYPVHKAKGHARKYSDF